MGDDRHVTVECHYAVHEVAPKAVKDEIRGINAQGQPVTLKTYTLLCCRGCRADFLEFLGQWSRGEMRPRRHDRPEATVMVRVNGAVVMMTPLEAEEHRKKSAP